ncbi:MAG: serine hydroxymethyltransferase [bacterium]
MIKQQNLAEQDQEIYNLIQNEEEKELSSIRLIPSENYASKAVREATGSILTNKYSEGYPGKRYYEGCEIIDQIENLARDRAKKLFNTDYHVNVQPYSGSPANWAVYLGLCEPGETIMGMNLLHGGHLTHGWKFNLTSKIFNAVQYSVNPDTQVVDFDELSKLAKEHQPKIIICGGTAIPRAIDFKAFRKVADEVGAYLLADISHIAGLIAAGVHESPFGIADIITSTSHKTLRGPRGAFIMCKPELAEKIDKAIMPGLQGGPHNNVTAAMAVAFAEAMTPEFKNYAKQIITNAQTLAKELINKGYKLITNGTDNHLILIDTAGSKNILGKEAASVLNKAGIICNANTIPFDPNPPLKPSGIRIGTPAITTLGMKEQEMIKIANWIDQALTNYQDEEKLGQIKEEIKSFMKTLNN